MDDPLANNIVLGPPVGCSVAYYQVVAGLSLHLGMTPRCNHLF